MPDDLERRAIIAAHDAGCDRQCGEDALTFRRLTSGEQAIVALWRDDRDAFGKANKRVSELETELLKMQEAGRNTIARAETAEAEVERLRTATGMADELGARVTDERNEAQTAIERVRAITYASDDGSEYEHTHPDGGEPECPACWAEGIRAALDRTEATDA